MKRSKINLKSFILGVLVCAIITTMCVPAVASNISKTITAYYNNIKIYVDDSLVTPTDANGNVVEPFIYNGTTYLPVRAISNALGKDVYWDGNTSSVYIGAHNSSSQTPTPSPSPSPSTSLDGTQIYPSIICSNGVTKKTNGWTSNKPFLVNGVNYNNGTTGVLFPNKAEWAYFTIDNNQGAYTTAVIYAANDDSYTSASMIVVAKTLSGSYQIIKPDSSLVSYTDQPDGSKRLAVDISGFKSLCVNFIPASSYNPNITLNTNGTINFTGEWIESARIIGGIYVK